VSGATVGLRRRPDRPGPRTRTLATVVLVVVAVAALLGGLELAGGGRAARELLGAALRPSLDPELVRQLAADAVTTVTYAVSAISVAVLLGLPAAVLVSGVVGGPRWRGPRQALRLALGAVRAVHEIVWALLLVTVLGLTPLAGILAIGVPYAATVARVVGERLQDVADAPVRALRTTGARDLTTLAYVHLPLAAADVAGYLTYRLECAVRSAAVLSFVGLGGIGFRITLALDDLAFDRAWTGIYVLVLLVALLDATSGRLRGRVAW
jgi:ABC-type phosphate/phosphonate transport system permease subunit